jgi:hypothetical protein
MAFLSRLFKKNKTYVCDSNIHHKIDSFADSVANHLNVLKHDMNLQKKWVDYLHSISNKIHEMHNDHKELTKKDINHVKSWINQLYKSQSKQENDIKRLENDILKLINKYKTTFENLQSKIVLIETNNKKNSDELKINLTNLINEKLKETHNKLDSFEKNLEESKITQNNSSKIMSNIQNTMFTNPERKLLNLLLNLPDPVSYSKIAEMTGNSVNTVRVVMNSLKKKDVVEENMLPSGEKLFCAKNKEKIKKIYNVEHI